jgi:hypothetical protein
VPIGADAKASFVAFAAVLQANVPTIRTSVSAHLVGINPIAFNASTSVYIWEEVDQAGVIAPTDELPDMLGVRDVARGFTWVEYETGERELYDLATDPAQLDNRAYDPAYSGVRQEYAHRLTELVAEIAAR